MGFLTQHIQHDLFILQTLFEKYNDDDRKLLVHLLLKYLMENKDRNGMGFFSHSFSKEIEHTLGK